MSVIEATGVDATYYLTKDLQRAMKFYSDALGLVASSEFPAGVEYVFDDGSAFGLSHVPDFWVQSGGAMFGVPDIHAAIAHFSERGYTMLSEPIESQACHVVWCQDTEGNTFALHQRKNAA